MIVIGLGHRSHVGKDTVADYLVKEYGFVKMAFADPLKRAAMEIFGFTEAQVSTQDGKATLDEFWDFTPRHALQKLGTEGVRDVFGQDTWVRAAERSLHNLVKNYARHPNENGVRVVFTDVRFKTEANWLKKTIGKVWRVDRPGITDKVLKKIVPVLAEVDGQTIVISERVAWFDVRTGNELHSSETDLIEWDGWDGYLTGSTHPDGGERLRAQSHLLLSDLLRGVTT